MLRHLSIRNFAIIDHIEIDFDEHLNIITGETGAGKSIILGALHMILGKRAELSSLRNPTEKAIIEGTFEIGHLQLRKLFEELDVDYETETIIRRELRPNGKSRAFVNDSPVKLDQLRKLSSALVDLHAQQDHAMAFGKGFFIDVLDKMSGQEKQVETYGRLFKEYTEIRNECTSLQLASKTQQQDLDFIEFQLHEIEQLELLPEDDEAINGELDLLENAGDIIEQLQSIEILMEDEEMGALKQLAEAGLRLHKLSGFSKPLEAVSDRMEALQLELNDIANTVSEISSDTEIDESRLNQLRKRRDDINRLLQKHRLNNVNELLELRESLQEKLNNIQSSDNRMAELEQEVKSRHIALATSASGLSSIRQKAVSSLTGAISDILSEIGMPHAQTALHHKPLANDALNAKGMDEFELYFSANKGVEQQPLKQVASGGERSRLLLAIKAVVARHTALSTMIFDEIDTGISGEVATKVGNVFRELTENHQLIAITHLPQIAARADKHHFVFKDNSKEKTIACIKVLDKDEQIVEIAKMLSGSQPGNSALSTASELIAIN